MNFIATFFTGIAAFFSSLFGNQMVPVSTQKVNQQVVVVASSSVAKASSSDEQNFIKVTQDKSQVDFSIFEWGYGSEYHKSLYSFTDGSKFGILLLKNNNKNILLYNGKEIGNEYDNIIQLVSSNKENNEIAFLAEKDQKQFVVYKGKEFGKEYDSISNQQLIDYKLAYIAKKNNKSFVVYDGKVVEGNYLPAFHPDFVMVKGGLYYIATENGKYFLVHNNEIVSEKYERIVKVFSLNDKIVFLVNNGGPHNLVIHDKKIISESDESVYDLAILAGKIFYSGLKNGKLFFSYDGKKYINQDGLTYSSPGIVGGRFIYMVSKNGRSYIVYDGKEYGKEYDNVIKIISTEKDNTVAYVVVSNNRKLIVSDGREVGKEYQDVDDPVLVGNDIAYFAYKDGLDINNKVLIYKNKEIIGYGSIWETFSIGGKLAIKTFKDGKFYLVLER